MLASPDPLWISRSEGQRVVYLPGMVMAPQFWRHYAPPSLSAGPACAYPLPAHYPWRVDDPAALLSTDEIVEAYAGAIRRDFQITGGGPGVTLVGHSTGAFISLLVARRHPELVERMILLGGFGCGRFEGAGHYAMRIVSWPLMGQIVFTRLLALWISTPERFRRGSFTCVNGDNANWYVEPATLAQEEIRQALAASDPDGIAGLVRWLYGQSIMGELGRIETPTLFIVGAKDAVVPPIHQLHTVRSMPNAACVIIPDVGHLPMVEAPQAFDRAAAVFSRMTLAAEAERTIRAQLARLARVPRRPRRTRRREHLSAPSAGRLTTVV